LNDTPQSFSETNAGAQTVQSLADRICENVQKVVVGKRDAVECALIALLCGGHALIEDVPGTGKTTLAKALAQSLGCRFKRIQFTPDLVPADVVGVNIYNSESRQFEFQEGPIFSEIVLADEINRASPRTQSALLEAMGERQVTVDGDTSPLPVPFFVLATLNPVEMEGTFPLPEAQLDRFFLRFSLGYPSTEDESEMLDRFRLQTEPIELKAVASALEITNAQTAVDRVQVSDIVKSYILSLIGATRDIDKLKLGASPRASLALQRASQAKAAIDGRDFVTPDDVKGVASAILTHRVIVDIGAELRGVKSGDVLQEILDTTPVPIEPEE